MSKTKIRLAAAGVIAAAAVGGTVAATSAGAAEPMIVGGGPASDAPWAAQVQMDGQFGCSGTIIAAEWVLTAKHCQADAMSVRIGSLNLGEGEEVQVDQQETATNGGDILLLHLAKPVETTYLALSDAADPAAGEKNSIFGWGRETPDGPASPVLKTAEVEVTGPSQDTYGGPAIGSQGIDGSSWKGDSGGPQVADGKQVGVLSTGDSGGTNENGNQNYASVAESRDWIKQTAGV